MKHRHLLAALVLALPLLASAETLTFKGIETARDFTVDLSADYEHQDDVDQMRAARVQEKISQITDLLNLNRGVTRSCKYVSGISTAPPRGRVALTFDDGPDARLTPFVLDLLKKYRIQATFFMKGDNASAHPDLVARAEREGHFIGNHSWNHPSFHKLSSEAQASQLLRTERVLAPYVGDPKLFRYPYGNSTCETNDLAHSRGYRIVGWHVDSCDWAFANNGSVGQKDAEICGVSTSNRSNFAGHVVTQLNQRGGGIILMHDIHPRTIHQLETIISLLLRQGYEFTSLADPGLQASLR